MRVPISYRAMTAMPFSADRTHVIKARIQERLNSGLSSDWELGFLNNMAERFDRYGTKTQLSDAQYNKLHKVLNLGNLSPKPDDVSVQDRLIGTQSRPATKNYQRGVRSSPKQPKKPRPRQKSLAQVANAPRRAVRRAQRELFLPAMLVMGVLAFIFAALPPGSTTPGRAVPTQQVNSSPYFVVTGSRVNQRDGPSTSNRVMGQLSEGTRVRKVGDQNGWSQIESTLGTGWMASQFLSSPRTQQVDRTTNRPADAVPTNIRTIRAGAIQVIDGDTVKISGQRANVRLVGFNTPETWRPSCNVEREVGERATSRLSSLIRGATSIEFKRVACACRPGTEGTSECNFGRQCGSLIVDGTDVGTTLINENLAVPYHCGATSCPPRGNNWCR